MDPNGNITFEKEYLTVDAMVVCPGQKQLLDETYNPTMSGDIHVPPSHMNYWMGQMKLSGKRGLRDSNTAHEIIGERTAKELKKRYRCQHRHRHPGNGGTICVPPWHTRDAHGGIRRHRRLACARRGCESAEGYFGQIGFHAKNQNWLTMYRGFRHKPWDPSTSSGKLPLARININYVMLSLSKYPTDNS